MGGIDGLTFWLLLIDGVLAVALCAWAVHVWHPFRH